MTATAPLRATELRFRTPEGIAFAVPLAGPMTRFLAWFIDVSVVTGVMVIVSIGLGLLTLVAPEIATAISMLIFFGLQIGYPIAAEWLFQGQTLGKRVLKIRVVDVEGHRLHFSQILIRNLLRAVDFLPFLYALGGLCSLVSARAQRLGDLAANTTVIRIATHEMPVVGSLLGDRFNSLRTAPHLCARLRQRVGPEMAAVALQTLRRRDELDDDARVQVLQHIAAHFRALVPFPDELVDGLADEQYVRNVLDVVLQPKARP
jgi:uncharacterized RDD family membrane protein YckC